MPALDFSPGALALYLRGHLYQAGIHAAYLRPDNAVSAKKAERRRVQKLARVSDAEWDAAWAGTLKAPAPRVRLWAAVGIVLGDHGVMLTATKPFQAEPLQAPAPEKFTMDTGGTTT